MGMKRSKWLRWSAIPRCPCAEQAASISAELIRTAGSILIDLFRGSCFSAFIMALAAQKTTENFY